MTDATFQGERRRGHHHVPQGAGPLLASDRLYRTLGDVAPGFLWLVDAHGHFVYVNKTWEEYTRSTLEQLNAHGWEQFNHPDELDQVRTRWTESGERREQFEMELRYRRHDGEYRWMLSRVVPVLSAGGQLEGWVGATVDIDELKKAHEALRQQEQDLSDFFENAAVPIHWVASDGTILRVNQAELDLLGYRRDEYIGRNVVDFHDEREVIEDILRRLSAGDVLHDR